MKAKRERVLGFALLILFVLACNMPGAVNNGSTEPPPSPGVTYVVVVENTPTPLPTDTPVPPTATESIPPKITLVKNSNCRLGPSIFYNSIDQIASGTELPVIGRSENSEWWQVVNNTGRECWIFYELATPNQDFSSLSIGEAPPLPGIPLNFFVADQQCLSAQKKFSVTLSWSSGGGETAFRIYRDGSRMADLKPTKFTFKDTAAPYNKTVTYEIEAVNENGASARAAQFVPACK